MATDADETTRRQVLRTFCILGVLAVTLVSCSKAQNASELTNRYRQAHDRKDMDAMLRLFCWDRVPSELKSQTEDILRVSFDTPIKDVKLTTELPKERIREFVRAGVRYKLNLQEVADLVISYLPPMPGATSEDHYAVGIKNGHYQIALMAPAGPGSSSETTPSKPQRNPATNSINPPAGTSATVPKGTQLVVRLAQDVGLKTIDAGGTFSATVAEPVVVNGVTAIPEGATVEGAVVKKGSYSPEIFLTSITVNGAQHKIRTVHSTFNETIVFPAGSQRAFELVSPLELNK